MQARTHKLRIRFYFHHLGCSGDQFSDPLQAASAGMQVLAGWKPAGVTVLQSKLCHSPVCGGSPELVPLSPHPWDDLQNLWSTWWYPVCPHLQWQHWNMDLYSPEDKKKKCFPCSSLKGFTSWQSISRPSFVGTEPLWMPPLSLTLLMP